MREEKEWQEGRRNAITQRKGGGLRVMLAMRDGERLEEHSAYGPIALMVRKGHTCFTAEGETVEAGPVTLLTCDAKVRHTLKALSNVVCLLNVASGG